MGPVGTRAWRRRSIYQILLRDLGRRWRGWSQCGPGLSFPVRTADQSGKRYRVPERADTAPWRPRAPLQPAASHAAQRGCGAKAPPVRGWAHWGCKGAFERPCSGARVRGLGIPLRNTPPHSPDGLRSPLPTPGLNLLPTPDPGLQDRPVTLSHPTFHPTGLAAPSFPCRRSQDSSQPIRSPGVGSRDGQIAPCRGREEQRLGPMLPLTGFPAGSPRAARAQGGEGGSPGAEEAGRRFSFPIFEVGNFMVQKLHINKALKKRRRRRSQYMVMEH